MFEFMYKYRAPILVVLLLGLVGFGAWGAIAGLVSRGAANPLWGKFRLPNGGEEIEIKLQRFQEYARRLQGNPEFYNRTLRLGLGDNEPEQMAWGVICLAAAARDAGFEVSREDLDGTLRAMSQTPEDKPVRASDEQRMFWEDVLLARMFRANFQQNPGGADYGKIYERFKTDNEELKARFVVFERPDPMSYTLDLTKDEDKKKLVDYWDANPGFPNQFGFPEQIDYEVLWVKFQDKGVKGFGEEFAKDFAEQTKDIEVTDVEIQTRFESPGNRNAYEALAAEEAERRAEELKEKQKLENERAKAEGREPKDLSAGDQPSDFELVKEYVRQEILIGKLLHKAWEQAKNDDTALEALGKRYNLKYAKKEKMGSTEVQTHPDFGTARVWQMLVGDFRAQRLKEGEVATYTTTTTGRYMEDIFDEPTNFMAVFKLSKFREPRNAELKDVRQKVLEAWRKQQADDAVKEKAEAFKKAIDDKVLEKLKDRVAELEAKRDADVAKELKEKELDPEKEDDKPRIEAIKARFQRELDRELNKDKAAHEAQAFSDAASEMGLSVENTGWIRKNSGSIPKFPDGLTLAEKKRRLFRKQQRLQTLATLDAGRVTAVDQETGAGLALVSVVDEKRQPAPAEMYQNPTQVQSIASQLNRNVAGDDFRFQNYRNDEWFKLSAPETEKAIEADRKAKARSQERAARRRQERAEAARKRAAEEAARRAAAQGNATNPDGKADSGAGKADTNPPKTDTKPSDGGN